MQEHVHRSAVRKIGKQSVAVEEGAVFLRAEIEHGEQHVLVDDVGLHGGEPRIGAALDAILNHAGAEYMDCYNAGIPADVWLAAGFTERVEGDGCIIPELPDPARAREHRVLLLHEQARELRLVQGRRRSGPTEPEINQNTPQRRAYPLAAGCSYRYDDCAYLFYM